jgi:hypothetical protein
MVPPTPQQTLPEAQSGDPSQVQVTEPVTGQVVPPVSQVDDVPADAGVSQHSSPCGHEMFLPPSAALNGQYSAPPSSGYSVVDTA